MLKIYTLRESKQWDQVVRTFKEYDVYWLSGYVKAFKLHGDGEPILFFYEDDKVKGINVVMKRDVACDKRFEGKVEKDKFFDFSTPYGYGGWLIEGIEKEGLFDEYEGWCRKNSIVSEFVRFHPVLKNQEKVSEDYKIIPLGYTVLLDLTSPDIIWSNLTSKNRNTIRKSQKNEVKIYNGRCPDIFESFKKIYDKTMDKDHADPYYYFDRKFYNSLLEDLPYNSQIFYAVYRDKIIASSIMLTANGRMNYHLSGSDKEYSHMASVNLILYEAALWGNANGYRTMYLGGGVGSGEDGLFKFKKSFYRKDDLNRFYIGKKIFVQDIYDDLVNMRGINESKFFPKYRA